MTRLILSSVFLCASLLHQQADAETVPWTWLHKKYISEQELAHAVHAKQFLFGKCDTPLFNQLVLSWNALRPAQGSLTFFARVRNAVTKEWGTWHRLATWGEGVQKSYLSDADSFSSNQYVRLEVSKEVMADAFIIKVKADKAANLTLLKCMGINTANFGSFSAEPESVFKDFSSVYIKGVPRLSQLEIDHPRADGLCSPTSCTMLVSYLTSRLWDPLDFAKKSYDAGLEKFGSWPFNTAHAFELSHGKIAFYVARLPSCKNLHDCLVAGLPVVISVRGPIEGAPRPYANGHLLLVNGYDAKTKEFLCHDPAEIPHTQVKKRYAAKSLLPAWERSHRLAYIAEIL